MSGLRIASKLSLPVDVAGEAIAILAKRGAGKTNTGRVVVEELYQADVQTVVLDPVSAWWGLRSSADGKSAGAERGEVDRRDLLRWSARSSSSSAAAAAAASA